MCIRDRFSITTRLLLVALAIDVLLSPKRFWRETTAVEKGATLLSAAFISYYAAFVLQMVGDDSRFYFPTLGPIAWLATRSLVRILGDATAWTQLVGTTNRQLKWLAAALLTCALAPSILEVLDEAPQKRRQARQVGRFNIAAMVKDNPGSIWFGTSKFAELPADFSMALTEVGRPGVLCPHQQIHDLSGLNDGWIIDAGGFSADTFFAKYRPDVIYICLLYTSPSPRDRTRSRMPSSA